MAPEKRDPVARQMEDYKKTAPKNEKIVTGSGNPVYCLTNSLTVGKDGPILLQDNIFLEEITRFNRERIPERVVHAKGAGAFGYFEVTQDITKYTKACVFSKIGKTTKVAVRFSTVPGERGSSDVVRTVRGFAIKFYTEDGMWDLVGQNLPIFLFRDPIAFPSFMRVQKRNPVTNIPEVDGLADMIVNHPETVHHMMLLFSDRGICDGYRHMHGYGVHAFKLVNARGDAVYCKFHLRTNQGIKNLSAEEAMVLTGKNPDYHTRDLYNHISNEDYPSWKLYIQVMTFKEAEDLKWNPFDETKIWPKKEFPLIEVGKLVLNKNPSNYFADVEQLCFSPGNMIPGIEASPSKLLQGRMFAYADAQRYRLGTNYSHLPVNDPFKNCGIKLTNYHRDGAGCFYNQGNAPMYYPNSFGGPEHNKKGGFQTFSVSGDVCRYDTSGENEDFQQAKYFYENVLSIEARDEMAIIIGRFLSPASETLKKRVLDLFRNVSEDLVKAIEKAVDKSGNNSIFYSF